jgi:hypothetical protein
MMLRHCERSEAIQFHGILDRFVAALLAMTAVIVPAASNGGTGFGR